MPSVITCQEFFVLNTSSFKGAGRNRMEFNLKY